MNYFIFYYCIGDPQKFRQDLANVNTKIKIMFVAAFYDILNLKRIQL